MPVTCITCCGRPRPRPTAALQKLNSGTAEAKAATGSIDADTTHGTTGFTAGLAPGLMDANFQKAAFSLPAGAWGQPVKANPQYKKTSLAGQCKPDCYFLINPIGATAKAGSDAAYTKLKSMIDSKYNPAQSVQSQVQAKMLALIDAFKSGTHYNPTYRRPPR